MSAKRPFNTGPDGTLGRPVGERVVVPAVLLQGHVKWRELEVAIDSKPILVILRQEHIRIVPAHSLVHAPSIEKARAQRVHVRQL